MKKWIVLTGLLLALTFTCCAGSAEETERFPGMQTYAAGRYTVGAQFPAGEYVLMSDLDHAGFFRLSRDTEGRYVIAAGIFKANAIVTVRAGEHLELMRCTAIPAEEYYAEHSIPNDQYNATLKVGNGYDLVPGQYRLVAQTGETGTYRIYKNSRYELAVDLTEFKVMCTVDLEEGQLLELNAGRVGRLIAAATPKPSVTPTPAPTPTPTGTDARAASDTDEDIKATPTPKKTATPEPKLQRVKIDERKSPVVRSAPSTKGEKVGTAAAGKIYTMLAVEDGWYKIRLDDGTEGWVYSSMAQIIP